jgi:hypothetical protein
MHLDEAQKRAAGARSTWQQTRRACGPKNEKGADLPLISPKNVIARIGVKSLGVKQRRPIWVAKENSLFLSVYPTTNKEI